MPSLGDIIKSDITKGMALGAGAALFAVGAIPGIMKSTRPLARAALKSGLLLYERGREVIAEAQETVEDLVAEVKAELAEESKQSAAAEEAAGSAQADAAPANAETANAETADAEL
jgi:hypothetical protein